MTDFPHQYATTATAMAEGEVTMTTDEGAVLTCNAPSQFGGAPGGQSPESLLTEAVASCFILQFRAIARFSSLEWCQVRCDAIGILDKIDRTLKFTGFELKVSLEIPQIADADKANRLLEKAKQTCLVSNSLACPTRLEAEVIASN
jgi:organic hydroperoxide reductase OsmC/OhrA